MYIRWMRRKGSNSSLAGEYKVIKEKLGHDDNGLGLVLVVTNTESRKMRAA
jgi:hypothetical protein